MVSVSNLVEGMVVGAAVSVGGTTYLSQYEILTQSTINRIKKDMLINKLWVLDLYEFRPLLMRNEVVVENYLNHIIYIFRNILNSILQDNNKWKSGCANIKHYLETNRDILFNMVSLRVNHIYTYEHSVNVALYNTILGINLELTDSEVGALMLGGLLHDIGKIRISNRILDCPTKLNEQDFNTIKKHPLYGLSIVGDSLDISDTVRYIVVQHHEKLNGTGYPYNAESGGIHYLAKITAVSDIFDALSSKRSYHDARVAYTCMTIMNDMVKEGSIDPVIVSTLRKNIILLPKNTNVILSDGTYGVVAKSTRSSRPILYVPEKQTYLNLKEDRSLKIERVF